MNPASWQGRRLVPRWRSLGVTLRSLELASPPTEGIRSPQNGYSLEVLASLERYHLHPSLITAAEVVEAALVSGDHVPAVDAARRLLSVDKNAMPLIREQAARLLMRAGLRSEVPQGFLVKSGGPTSLRSRVRTHSRDALAWVELSLEQTIRGHVPAALRSMSVAAGLAPHNRHVIRSASRLFLHAGDREKAHAVVARNSATPGDPWLIASEIALAEVAERKPRFLKVGQKILEKGGMQSRQITELAGAIGTEELLSGNRRASRRSFRQSMLDPTGNALAQGEWATPEIGDDLIPESFFSSAPEPAEATAMHHFKARDFARIPDACREWAASDPFSIRPFEFACATMGMVEDYRYCIDFALDGLAIRPAAPSLLNAAAFAFASSGEPERAAEYLRQIPSTGLDDHIRFLTAANKGLVAFRTGDVLSGLNAYQEAIEGFKKAGNPYLSARARIYLAREALLAGLPDADRLVEEARKANEKYKDEQTLLVAQLETTFQLIKQKK